MAARAKFAGMVTAMALILVGCIVGKDPLLDAGQRSDSSLTYTDTGSFEAGSFEGGTADGPVSDLPPQVTDSSVDAKQPSLKLTVDFDGWSWDKVCPYGGCCGSLACFKLLGAPNARPVMVRRVDSKNSCAWDHEVRRWVGGLGTIHGNLGAGNWVVSNYPGHTTGASVPDTLEMLTSRAKQSRADGFIQAELFIHGPDVPIASGERYVVAHNMQLTPVTGCTADSSDPSSATNCFDTGSSCTGGWEYYGVMAGSFNSSSLGGDKVGFIVFRRVASQEELIPESYLSTMSGDVFPGETWYRIRVERSAGSYTYTVWVYSSQKWTLYATRTITTGLLQGGTPLPPGYVGVFGGFFDKDRGAADVHADWDKIEVDW